MSFTERVAELFKAKPGQWIDGRTLAQHGGAYAWRSRVSDCRKLGLSIANRQRKVNGLVVSEYKLVVNG
jgi:hypothetical protein